MPMLPRITSLEPCDLPDFAALLRQDGRAPETFLTAHRQHLEGRRTILVVRRGETVVGFVSVLHPAHPASLDEGACEATHEITGLYVSIVHRGQGLGRALLRSAEACAMTHGARQTSLVLSPRHDGAARHLATSLGYEEAGDCVTATTPWTPTHRCVKSLLPLPFPRAHSLAA